MTISFQRARTLFDDVDWDVLRRLVRPSRHVTRLGIDAGRESSTRQLNRAQTQAFRQLDDLREGFSQVGQELILEGFKNYLIAQYQANPATYQGRALPLDYFDGLTEDEKKCYYRHSVHTAYRYLFCSPNPWLRWGTITAINGAASISPEHRETIALFWWALLNEARPLAEGVTYEDAKRWLVNTLAAIGRQHNWDRTRVNAQGQNENYDDMQGDNPACAFGVRQNLAQYLTQVLVVDSNFSVLTVDIMLEKFKDFFISHSEGRGRTIFDRIDTLDLAGLEGLNQALDNFIAVNAGDFSALSAQEQEILSAFSWRTSDIMAFIRQCRAQYGDSKIDGLLDFRNGRIYGEVPPQVVWRTNRFYNFGELILALAENPFDAYYYEIKGKIESKMAQMRLEPAQLEAQSGEMQLEVTRALLPFNSPTQALQDSTSEVPAYLREEPVSRPEEVEQRFFNFAHARTVDTITVWAQRRTVELPTAQALLTQSASNQQTVGAIRVQRDMTQSMGTQAQLTQSTPLAIVPNQQTVGAIRVQRDMIQSMWTQAQLTQSTPLAIMPNQQTAGAIRVQRDMMGTQALLTQGEATERTMTSSMTGVRRPRRAQIRTITPIPSATQFQRSRPNPKGYR